MKYGIAVYFDTENLGDDIQTYAAERFLPQVDYVIDREKMDAFYTKDGSEVAVILSGWYFYMHINWPPSPFIRPLLTSMHFDTYYSWLAGERITKNYVFEDYGGEWLKQNGSVGCRDYETLNLLSQFEIPAYFSGCLTLTLEPYKNVDMHGKICLVDVPEKVIGFIEEHSKTGILKLSHVIQPDRYSWKKRREVVEERLKLYQGAALVVTTRLHAALPCLAFGIPVLFIKEKWSLNRTATWLDFLNYTTEEDLLSGVYQYDFACPMQNPDGYVSIRNDLIKKCREFIACCEREKNPKQYDVEMFLEGRKRIERMQKLFLRRTNKYERALKGELKMGYDCECHSSDI